MAQSYGYAVLREPPSAFANVTYAMKDSIHVDGTPPPLQSPYHAALTAECLGRPTVLDRVRQPWAWRHHIGIYSQSAS